MRSIAAIFQLVIVGAYAKCSAQNRRVWQEDHPVLFAAHLSHCSIATIGVGRKAKKVFLAQAPQEVQVPETCWDCLEESVDCSRLACQSFCADPLGPNCQKCMATPKAMACKYALLKCVGYEDSQDIRLLPLDPFHEEVKAKILELNSAMRALYTGKELANSVAETLSTVGASIGSLFTSGRSTAGIDEMAANQVSSGSPAPELIVTEVPASNNGLSVSHMGPSASDVGVSAPVVYEATHFVEVDGSTLKAADEFDEFVDEMLADELSGGDDNAENGSYSSGHASLVVNSDTDDLTSDDKSGTNTTVGDDEDCREGETKCGSWLLGGDGQPLGGDSRLQGGDSRFLVDAGHTAAALSQKSSSSAHSRVSVPKVAPPLTVEQAALTKKELAAKETQPGANRSLYAGKGSGSATWTSESDNSDTNFKGEVVSSPTERMTEEGSEKDSYSSVKPIGLAGVMKSSSIFGNLRGGKSRSPSPGAPSTGSQSPGSQGPGTSEEVVQSGCFAGSFSNALRRLRIPNMPNWGAMFQNTVDGIQYALGDPQGSPVPNGLHTTRGARRQGED